MSRGMFEIMDSLASEYGCIVQVGRGPYGWNCTIHDPEVSGTNVARHTTAEEAVHEAVARWAAKQYAHFPHLRAEGITVP